MRTKRNSQTGDTLIEVLLALVVLGVLIVVGYTVMSRGTAMIYNSLDRSNAQAIINGQAAALRAFNQIYLTTSNVAFKNSIKQDIYDKAKTYTTQAAMNADEPNRADGCKTGMTDYTKMIYFTNFGSNVLPNVVSGPSYVSDPKRQGAVPKAGDGIWVEGYKITLRTDGTFDPYTYTFYIKSCNLPVYGDGTDVLRQNKTTVRLYAP